MSDSENIDEAAATAPQNETPKSFNEQEDISINFPATQHGKTKGFILLHRSMEDHWLWKTEKFSKGQAFVDLILMANYTTGKINIKGELITVHRGQLARSMVTLAKRWNWSKDKVKRFLVLLEREGVIRYQTSNLTTVITLCNYEHYQGRIFPNNTAHDAAKKQQTNIKQDTNNKDNKNNNIFTKPVHIKNEKPESSFISKHTDRKWAEGLIEKELKDNPYGKITPFTKNQKFEGRK